jgi:IS5 family transposase
MGVVCSSKILVNIHWTTRHHIPEDSTLHRHCCENPRSKTERKRQLGRPRHRGEENINMGLKEIKYEDVDRFNVA